MVIDLSQLLSQYGWIILLVVVGHGCRRRSIISRTPEGRSRVGSFLFARVVVGRFGA